MYITYYILGTIFALDSTTYIFKIKKKNYFIVVTYKILFSRSLCALQAEERCVPLSLTLSFLRRARKLCAPSISGEQSTNFFLAHTTFHLRRPATVSDNLSAKRRCGHTATRTEPSRPNYTGLQANPLRPRHPS